MEIRCRNAVYMHYFKRYLTELFKRVRPHLCSNGGNVVMLQVENEYGYYGDDKEYLAELVRFYREQGMDSVLVTSDGIHEADLADGTISGCLPTLNFGSRVKEAFEVHDRLYPNVPKMCMETWDGWFDAWGDEKHHTTSAEDYVRVVEDMLEKGSMNTYMFIGGTNFGFTNGANHYEKFLPDVTSYDYDALLSECGDVTPKYYAVREVVKKCVDRELPPVPKNREKKAYGEFFSTLHAELFENLDALGEAVKTEMPKSMEDLGFGYGYVVYRTKLNRDYVDATISFSDIGDRAHVFVGDDLCGVVYVNEPPYEVTFSAKAGDVLTVLCENMGRTNFGVKMMRKKGINGTCLINGRKHFGWSAYHLSEENIKGVKFVDGDGYDSGKSFYKFTFNIDGEPKDTFLRLDSFRKGFAVLNGFNLGRYWEVGPQKTLYVPAPLLVRGENELIVFESDGLKGLPKIEFTDTPDLG